MARIGFLGTGAMGARMAARLLVAGHDLQVWNRTAARAAPLIEKGAHLASTPRAAAEGADFVIAMVRDDAASKEVWLDRRAGALAAMTRDSVAIECSTLSLQGMHDLARTASASGISLIDAPLAGSRPQAEAGQLIFFAGGVPSAVKQAESVLLAMGAAVHHAGEVGAGTAIKLAVNMLFGVQVCAVAEALALLEAAGLDPGEAFAKIAETPVVSGAAKAAASSMIAGAFAPMFPVALVEKDFGYALSAARDPKLMTVARAAYEVFRRAGREGLAQDNLTSVVKLVRRPR